MKINIKEYFNRFSSSQKRLIAFFLVFALIGTVALIRTYALTSKNQKVFFHNSSGVQHDVGRVATEPGANFFGKTNEVWSSYQTKSTDGYLWKGPGEKIAASSSPQKLVTCFAVYDVGNLYWNNPANVTFEIAADNGGQVLESDTRTLSDGFKKKYWFGYFPHCISETLAANTEYNGMTYRLKVNRGGIRIAWVQRTIETEVDPAFTVTGLKDGDVVSGNFSVQTNHTNVDGFEKYAYYLDGNLHNEEKKPIWCFNGDNGQACNPYDSTQLSNGNHSMKIVMHYGGITAEKTINFSVNNNTTTPTPPPSPTPGETPEMQEIIDNAGPSNPSALKPSGSIVATTPGQVIENLDISGAITVKANNVTIRNVRIKGSSSTAVIRPDRGISGTTVENCHIIVDANGANGGVGYLGSNTTVRNCEIEGYADGIKAEEGGLYENNYIHMWKPDGSAKHLDGIQGSGDSNFTIRNNVIDAEKTVGGNAAIFVQAFYGSGCAYIKGINIYGNYVRGGNYTVYIQGGKADKYNCGPDEGKWILDVKFTDNIFDKGTWYAGKPKDLVTNPLFGYLTIENCTTTVTRNNTFYDGSSVPGQCGN